MATNDNDKDKDNAPPAPPPAPPAPPAPPKAAPVMLMFMRPVETMNIITMMLNTSFEAVEVELPAMPESVELVYPMAYLDDAGSIHGWTAGQTVTDADQIADLVAHGAVFKG